MSATRDKPVVLVVDDEPALRGLCATALQADFDVIQAVDGQDALKQVFHHRPDAVLLDVTMPVMDGFDACRRIRELTDVPIIMLTALGEDHHVARGLDSGADDYITKPFSKVPLLARLRAVMRRRRGTVDADPESAPPELLSFHNGELVIDTGRRAALVNGKEVQLSAVEYKVLETLARHPGQVLTHDQILERVWGYEYAGETGYVKTYIGLLRSKIEPNTRRPRYIQTRRSIGYMLEPRAPA